MQFSLGFWHLYWSFSGAMFCLFFEMFSNGFRVQILLFVVFYLVGIEFSV